MDLENITQNLDSEIASAKSDAELTNLWRKYLGREGLVTEAFKKIGEVPAEERKDFGQKINKIKNEVDQKILEAKNQVNSGRSSEYLGKAQAELDNKKPKVGHIHPLTQTANELNEIFKGIGYSIMDGPEIETDEYCFQRMNLPLDHPARDLQDSIFIEEPNILLRTQTSSIEARALEMYKPPFKIVVPGRVYRNEKVNKSNHFTFHQYQLVCIQEKVSMADLFATINHLFKTYLGEDVVTRFRNKYYPEVEPGVGPDMQCFNCKGSGIYQDERCGVCKGRGWIEMGGSGIIHPNVIKAAGLDPAKWQGYAFGLGLDRWAMAKHNINDIRTLLDGNLAYQPNN